MIRVNLLKDQGVNVRKRAAEPQGSRMGLALMILLVLILSGMGTSWYYLGNQVRLLRERRDLLRTENERVQQSRKQIDELEKLKRLRQSRIEVIEKLRDAQTGPVLILNQVIRSMPRDAALWLTLLDQEADRVRIKGYAMRSESILDFMSNLSRSGYFTTVDLELIEAEKNAARFSLICSVPRKTPSE
jgi:Tfp pilus assembly protein PilN